MQPTSLLQCQRTARRRRTTGATTTGAPRSGASSSFPPSTFESSSDLEGGPSGSSRAQLEDIWSPFFAAYLGRDELANKGQVVAAATLLPITEARDEGDVFVATKEHPARSPADLALRPCDKVVVTSHTDPEWLKGSLQPPPI